MAIYLETTDVPDFKTVGEIQDVLARHGATSVQIEYDRGRPQGVSFKFTINNVPIPFKLPCRWDAIQKIFEKNNVRVNKKDTMENKARRVAWRQVLAWVKAQFALVECGMVDRVEVFLPYAIVRSANSPEQTLAQFVHDKGILSLPAPKES